MTTVPVFTIPLPSLAALAKQVLTFAPGAGATDLKTYPNNPPRMRYRGPQTDPAIKILYDDNATFATYLVPAGFSTTHPERIRLGTLLPIRAPSPRAPPRSSRALFLPAAGALVSEPTYPLRLDAVFLHGSDLLRFGPHGAHARASTTRRTIDVSGPAGKVLKNRKKGGKTTDFGDAFIHPKFRDEPQRAERVGNKVHVESGRFLLEQGKPSDVEYDISEVTA
ncbi:hypothetical protein C8035_v012011 [Colletotrichum spinosum]|uniref:Uncharacterized protein n=1 Tax=Colletotrichum spinosum TaxID=1347390 RepID=A0A4R8PNX6_9PEZI|nr:hypothetical protein C8035_v012011 [Colletotrichum spinosum]